MELLEMAVESADGTFSNPSRETLKELERANNAFHDAVDEAVLVWLKTPGNIDKVKLNHPKLKGDDTPAKVANSLVYETDLAYYFYMGAIGHGVRMTDGSLNPFFMDNDYVAELEAFLRQKIRSEVHKLESAIDNAAYESMGESDKNASFYGNTGYTPQEVWDFYIKAVKSGNTESMLTWYEEAKAKGVWLHALDNAMRTDGRSAPSKVPMKGKYARKTSVSDKDIKALMAEADNAGDTAQVKLCQKALKGDAKARKECEKVIHSNRDEE
jgi:hypothetical protein